MYVFRTSIRDSDAEYCARAEHFFRAKFGIYNLGVSDMTPGEASEPVPDLRRARDRERNRRLRERPESSRLGTMPSVL